MIGLFRKIEIGVEESILFTLILLNIIEFFHALPGEIKFAKSAATWLIISILLYRFSLVSICFGKRKKEEELSEVFFGIKNRDIDILIVIAYFSLIMNSLIDAMHIAKNKLIYFEEFYLLIINNSKAIETGFFYFGGSILILISIYLATKVKIKKPSVMHIIHE